MKTILLAIRALPALAARRLVNLLPVMAMALSFAAPTTAAEEGDPTGFYAGAGIAFAEFDCPSGFTCSDTEDTASYLYIGGMFNEHFGMELGHLNKAEFALSQGSTSGKVEYSALYYTLIGRLPFNDNIAVFAKLGGASTRASASFSNTLAAASVFASDTGLMYGGGLEIQSGNFAGRLEAQQTDADIVHGGLSILYRFR